ncbi:hypothetical protein C0992_003487 [Termitomyces sp. T32_za158]|nr:hypothetical protein C0992_003487 [Termitomyces sp. T32_za158]
MSNRGRGRGRVRGARASPPLPGTHTLRPTALGLMPEDYEEEEETVRAGPRVEIFEDVAEPRDPGVGRTRETPEVPVFVPTPNPNPPTTPLTVRCSRPAPSPGERPTPKRPRPSRRRSDEALSPAGADRAFRHAVPVQHPAERVRGPRDPPQQQPADRATFRPPRDLPSPFLSTLYSPVGGQAQPPPVIDPPPMAIPPPILDPTPAIHRTRSADIRPHTPVRSRTPTIVGSPMDLRSPGWEDTDEQVVLMTNDQLRRFLRAYGQDIDRSGESDFVIVVFVPFLFGDHVWLQRRMEPCL